MIEKYNKLITILEEAKVYLGNPHNDFGWSPWENSEQALAEIDDIIINIRSGSAIPKNKMSLLFAPTGAIQEVSIPSGWAEEFLELASRFDEAEEEV